MSTRSYIGKWDGDSIKAIYCHFDGYPNGVGRMLKEHYNSDDKIDELISLGGISSLGEKTKLEPIDDTIELTDGRKCKCVVSDGKITFSIDSSETSKFSVFDFPYSYTSLKELDKNLSNYIDELRAKLDKVTVAYHRDRGEDLTINTFSNESDYSEISGIDYLYLWKNGYWTIADRENIEFKRF